MSCSAGKTHKLEILVYPDHDDVRQWRNLSTGAIESDAAILLELEAEVSGENCVGCVPECVESQEWTYGIDNTGTDYRWADATYELELSDGTIWEWEQTAASNGGWTAQLTEWAAANQTQADNAGVKFFVEPRFIDDTNPTNIDGTIGGPGGTPSGLPGAPSAVVAQALRDGGMSWRYVNFQVCPGQPVPVAARLIRVDDQGAGRTPPALPYDLTAAGPVLGPIQKFFVCRECGKESIWYLEDGVTLADAGQIPNCYEPCGVLATLPPPPSSDCSFEISVACDNNNSTNTVDFTNTITRRAKICNGEQIAVDYFEADPLDPGALIPYTLNGDFVDCATGEPVPLPVPPCDDFEITTLYAIENKTDGARNREWITTDPVLPQGNLQAARDYVVGFDRSITPDTDTIVTSNIAAINDTDNTAAVLDIQIRQGFLCVDKPTPIRFSANSEGAIFFSLGKCGGELIERIAYSKGVGVQETSEYVIPPGIHSYELINLDSGGSNSNWTPQTTADGITWVNDNTIFDAISSTTEPFETCKVVKVCTDSAAIFSVLTGELIDPAMCRDCPLPVCTPDSNEQNETIQDREVCLDVNGTVLNAYAILCVSKTDTALLRYEDGFGNVVEGTPINCNCDAVDLLPDNGPIGDQATCSARKLGADFVSNAALEGTHTAGSLYDGTGPLISWTGTFVVTDSLNNTHTFTDGATVTGMAPGSTQQVIFTGTIHWSDPALGEFRCDVTNKAISANFTVQ